MEYPRRDAWTIGFITGQTTGEVQERTPDEVVNVYVPTTPNPTSGFLLYIPVKDGKPLDMSVEDAVKMVISVGMVTPPYTPDAGRRKESLSTLESDPDSPEADNSLETPSET